VEPGAEERIQSSELSGLLTRALATLDAERRAILVLRDVRGLDYSQIASVLGIAEGTVKSRLFRAREALKTSMEQLASETTTPGEADPD
jgi:RNA polymerase sigma-70 factor (ECF subfamily)